MSSASCTFFAISDAADDEPPTSLTRRAENSCFEHSSVFLICILRPPSNTTSQWYLLVMSAISSLLSLGTTSGLRVLSSEFTETARNTGAFCNTMGPPADIE